MASIQDLDSVYVITNHGEPGERVLARSDAVLHLLKEIGGIWTIARLARALPKPLRDLIYNLVARNRYRVFGKYETCLLPEPRHRQKFLDVKISSAQDA